MKILLCHNLYREPGGERRAVEQLHRLLTTRGHEVVLYQRDNREIDDWGLLEKARFPATALWSHRTVVEIREIVRREGPDVAHVHNVFPLLSPSLYRALADAGLPIVQTVHNFRLLCPNGLFFTHGHVCQLCKTGNTLHAVRLECYRDSRVVSGVYAASIGLHRKLGTFSRIDRFLAPSEFTAEELVTGGVATTDRVTVIPHFTPSPLPAVGVPETDPPYVLYMGRLVGEKGIDLLIDAMADLKRYRLVVAGEGPERATLERHARVRGADNVQFAGFVSGEDKRTLLSRAWVTAAPSRWYEGFGLSVLEGFRQGVPTVVSAHGSLAELVRGGLRGLSFRPGDSADLREKLHQALRDPDSRLRWSREAREAAETLYAEETVYGKLLGAYEDVRRQ